MSDELEFDEQAPAVKAALSKLTDNQRKFVVYTFRGCGPQDAAKRAGYRGRNLDTQASRLMRNPKVLQALEALALSPNTAAPQSPTEELKSALWAIVRSAHPKDRISAVAVLHRIQEAERDREPELPPLAKYYVGQPDGDVRLADDILATLVKVLRSNLERGVFPHRDEAHRETLREVSKLAGQIARLPMENPDMVERIGESRRSQT